MDNRGEQQILDSRRDLRVEQDEKFDLRALLEQ